MMKIMLMMIRIRDGFYHDNDYGQACNNDDAVADDAIGRFMLW